MKEQTLLNIKREIYLDAVSYWRKYPDEFCEQVLGIKLVLFQKVMMRVFFRYKYVCFVMGRGIGKSFITILCLVIYALLYPNSKLGIIAPSFRQAKQLITEKYRGELCEWSGFLLQEEKSYTCNMQKAKIEFYNGSFIEAFPLGNAGEKIRGARLHVALIDEAVYVPRNIITEVVMPMTIVKPGFKVGEDNNEIVNGNKIIMASSASYRSNHLYKTFVDWTKEMMTPGNTRYFTMTLPWQVGVQAGYMDEADILEKKKELSAMAFAQEYEGVFPNLIDGAWINPEDLFECCDLEHIELKGDSNYEYIMSVDVARVEGQDNTVIMVFKLKWRKDHIEPELVYIKALNGCPFFLQASEVRAIYRRFPTTIRIFQDTQTIGQGLSDELAKDFYCEDTEEWERPLIDMNDEVAMKNKDKTNGLPIIYGLHATAELNHRFGYAVKKYTEKHWLHLYAEFAGESDHEKHDTDFSTEELMLIEQTKETQNEVIAIQAIGGSNGFMKFITKGKLKDRWSALSMGLYGVEMIRKERDNQKSKKAMIGFCRRNTDRRGGF